MELPAKISKSVNFGHFQGRGFKPIVISCFAQNYPAILTTDSFSSSHLAAELELNKDDAQQMTAQLRSGVVEKKPEITLDGVSECDKLYLIAGFKGLPEQVLKRRGDSVLFRLF